MDSPLAADLYIPVIQKLRKENALLKMEVAISVNKLSKIVELANECTTHMLPHLRPTGEDQQPEIQQQIQLQQEEKKQEKRKGQPQQQHRESESESDPDDYYSQKESKTQEIEQLMKRIHALEEKLKLQKEDDRKLQRGAVRGLQALGKRKRSASDTDTDTESDDDDDSDSEEDELIRDLFPKEEATPLKEESFKKYLRPNPSKDEVHNFMNALGWDLCHLRSRCTWKDGKVYYGKVMPELAINKASRPLGDDECFFFFTKDKSFDIVPRRNVTNIPSDWRCGTRPDTRFEVRNLPGAGEDHSLNWPILLNSYDFWQFRFGKYASHFADLSENDCEIWLRKSIALIENQRGIYSEIWKLLLHGNSQ